MSEDSNKKSFGKKAAAFGGLGALILFETPVHESMHCGVAEVTGGNCSAVYIDDGAWYAKPLEYATVGFYESKDLPKGVAGMAMVAPANNTEQMGYFEAIPTHLGNIATAGFPEFFYTTLGMGLVASGIKDYKSRPVWGLTKTVAGGLAMSSTLNYMRISMSGAKAGHDYHSVTASVIDMAGTSKDTANSIADYATPLIGIPLLLAGAYFTAGFITDKGSSFWKNRKEKKALKKAKKK